jgi:hypothetical protein
MKSSLSRNGSSGSFLHQLFDKIRSDAGEADTNLGGDNPAKDAQRIVSVLSLYEMH